MIKFVEYKKYLAKKRVLDIPDTTFSQHKIHGIIGQNGSGKTMLLRAVCGLIYPTSGFVKVNEDVIGKDISFPRNCGLIIENIGFWPNLSGIQNLELLAQIRKKIGKRDIEETLDRVGLSIRDAKSSYSTYSLGMRQKLAVAQAIMEKPELLLLDEPTNALDNISTDKLWRIINEEKERGATILLASHHREDIQPCDHVYEMNNGSCTQIR